MGTSRLRFILAMIIVGGYLVIVASVVLAAVFLGFDHDFAIEVIEELSKVMAGFVGLVIGYYFYRGQARANENISSGPSDGGRLEDANPNSSSS